MLNKNKIHTYFTNILLVIALVSFSDYTSASVNNQKQHTELIYNTSITKNKDVQIYLFKSVSKHINYNQYILFNFKCLLNIHSFDFSVALKSQKETTLQFLKHPFLEQNLISQINASKYQNSFIK